MLLVTGSEKALIIFTIQGCLVVSRTVVGAYKSEPGGEIPCEQKVST